MGTCLSWCSWWGWKRHKLASRS